MHKSIATIDSPEFINLQPLDINPLMSSCEIKVLYLGENRNHSFINKEVATEMAKTLRGAPIVGYFKEEKQDFADHGERVIFDDEGVKFECMTKPYGFVAPDAKVWFQKFEDTDDFGNIVNREYLMTTGYLWTGQFEECQRVVDSGNPQSMELDEETLDGHWATNNNSGMDFFIINDAVFSKLCILGEDVEPCFEGASVTAPDVSTSFTKVDDTFKQTLYSMMQELKFALEGGRDMEIDKNVEDEVLLTEDQNSEAQSQDAVDVATDFEVKKKNDEADSSDDEGKEEEGEETVSTTPEDETEDNTPEGDESDDATEGDDNSDSNDDGEGAATDGEDGSFALKDDDKKEDSEEEDESKDEEEDKEEKYALLETQFTELSEKYSALEKDYQALVEFKAAIDNEKKDALIKSFYMLSEEDKKEVIENKANYSLDEIEAKLSVICFRKKVNFDLENSDENQEDIEDENEAITTYSFTGNTETGHVPAWIMSVKNLKNQKED